MTIIPERSTTSPKKSKRSSKKSISHDSDKLDENNQKPIEDSLTIQPPKHRQSSPILEVSSDDSKSKLEQQSWLSKSARLSCESESISDLDLNEKPSPASEQEQLFLDKSWSAILKEFQDQRI